MQIFCNGIIEGLQFALIGLAFATVYNTTKTFHLALGAIYSLAAYLFWSCLTLHLPWGVSVIVTVVLCGVVGALCEIVLHWPFSRKSSPQSVHMIGSLGMYLVIIQIIILTWGNDNHLLRKGLDQTFVFNTISFTQVQVIGVVIIIVVIAIFFLFMRYSEAGLLFRAISDNQTLLKLMGKNVRSLRLTAFFVSGILISMVSIINAYDVGFNPNRGMKIGMIGVVATIIGGRNSFAGTVLAGLVLGIIQNSVVAFTNSSWEEAVTFMVLAIVLFIKPNGLFSNKVRMEENG